MIDSSLGARKESAMGMMIDGQWRAADFVARRARRERAVRRAKGPALVAHERIYHRNRGCALQLLHFADDERAMRPWTCEREVQMVAAGLRLEAADSGGPRPAIDSHPIAKDRRRSDERGAGGAADIVAAPPRPRVDFVEVARLQVWLRALTGGIRGRIRAVIRDARPAGGGPVAPALPARPRHHRSGLA